MRRISKRVLALLMAAVMVFGCIPAVYGAVQEALSVEIITDKEEYAKGEEAKITLKFTNTGNVNVTNITGNITVPEGIELSEECSTTVTLSKLTVGTKQEIVLDGVVADETDKNDTDKNETAGGNVDTGDGSTAGVYALMAVTAVAAVVLVVSKKKDIKKIANVSAVVLVFAAIGAMMATDAEAAEKSIKAEKTIKIDGEDAVITAVVTYDIESIEEDDTTGEDETTGGSSEEETTTGGTEDDSSTNDPSTDDPSTDNPSTDNPSTDDPSTDDPSTDDPSTDDPSTGEEGKLEVGSRVSVHDPSIVKDPETGMYYIFGSHMAWAKSEDLVSWTTFKNNINTNFATIFAKEAEWAARGSATYDLSGNLWAPDVIWNEELGKWCMYMSVNGDHWYTSVALLTADRLDGNWTYVGPIVYSGFTNAEEAADTDLAKVIGTNEVPDRYLENRNGNHTYGMNAIDPCVFYDEDGNLWMAYGSWFGGIYMLKLDETTGLRDYTYTYETVANTSDEYQGIKIAGGDHSSGEAPYIEKIGDYYYLFLSYGGLTATGGYNMRVFRSENPTGPYVDGSGDDARFASYYSNINGTVGIKILGNYKWSYMEYGQVAQGHNSTFVDEDGRAYVIYHTRTTDGTEGHTVRVHQLFVNEEGWLVAAPYEYTGETISESGYEKAEVLGTYEVLYHKQSINYGGLECATAQALTLNADGTVSGDYTGTWTMTEDTPYVQLVLGGTEYKGVFVEQYIEEYDEKTMCFTVFGDNEIELWGSKYLTGSDAIDMSLYFDILSMPEAAVSDIAFDMEGLYGTTATYKSSNTAIISDNGAVTRPENDTDVVITATYKNGDVTVTKDWTVKVLGTNLVNEQLLVGEFYTDEECKLNTAVEGTYKFPNPFNKNVTNGLEIYNGVTIEFDVTGTGPYLSTILSFQGGGRLYFTGGSYLGYNALGGFFDANVKNSDPWAAGTDFINGDAHIKINLTGSGFEVYANGVLAYDSTDLANGDIQGSSSITGYSNVLKWLNETAETIDFGWGSWWADKFNGTISNVKLYITPPDEIDTEGYVYYDTFSAQDSSKWTVQYDSFAFSFGNDGDSYGSYVSYVNTIDPNKNAYPSGNRSARTTFELTEALSGGYNIEADFRITPGSIGNTQFVITGEDFAFVADPSGGGATSGYILKLSTTAGSNVYTVNDGSSTVTIPKGEWTHVSAIVDNEGDVKATFTFADGTTTTVDTEVNGSGALGGLYMLRGRGGAEGNMAVDNVRVSLDDTDVEGIVIVGATEAEVAVTGTAYPDENSTVTVTFTSAEGTEISDTCKVLINDTEVVANSVVNMVTVKSITFDGNVATVTLDVAAINGWHSVVGSYDVKLMNGTVEMAKTTVEYAMEMSSDTVYTAIAPATNESVKAYYKIDGTKMYVMTIIDGTIHCDGVTAGDTTYEWWNGVCSQIYMTIDGTEYSVGSHVYNNLYANAIGWAMEGHTADYSLITADVAYVTRSYMALGTFDDDTDVDTGCVLLNVVDLSLVGYTEETLSGKTVTFCGYIGPNDTSGRFEAVTETEEYVLD